ncbi:MAG: response regulator receiver domain [Verrucomicrobia bacterium]|nr:response regulator receiver domain [Verrucomicrobiota bacterium]
MPRIVIIEDDEMLSGMLKELLLCAGYLVASAANGFEGMAAVRAERTDLVITDMFMPHGGLATLRVLRAEFPALPVIAMSGAPARLQMATDLGACRILEKPFNVGRLLRTVAETLTAYDHGPGGSSGLGMLDLAV